MNRRTASLMNRLVTRKTALRMLSASLGAPWIASAQTGWPAKPINWIVPWPAGGSADLTSRTIGAELGKQLGQPVTIDNAAGGGGVIGLNKAAQAAPDGYTIYLGGSELVVPPMINDRIKYDWKKLFKPVARTVALPLIFATRTGAPYTTLDEFTKYARKNPGKVSYASPGIGSSQHMVGEMMRERAKLALVHVPYRGGAQIVTDLLGGTIDTAVLVGSTAMPYLKNGKLKGLAVADTKRLDTLRDVPAFSESRDYPRLVLNPWQAVMVPLNTPDELVARLSLAISRTLANPEVARKLGEAGFSIRYAGSAELGKFIDEETMKYQKIVQFAGMKSTE
jgi:tripartite-type tricarboxylate transporter receptor subunit TctC